MSCLARHIRKMARIIAGARMIGQLRLESTWTYLLRTNRSIRNHHAQKDAVIMVNRILWFRASKPKSNQISGIKRLVSSFKVWMYRPAFITTTLSWIAWRPYSTRTIDSTSATCTITPKTSRMQDCHERSTLLNALTLRKQSIRSERAPELRSKSSKRWREKSSKKRKVRIKTVKRSLRLRRELRKSPKKQVMQKLWRKLKRLRSSKTRPESKLPKMLKPISHLFHKIKPSSKRLLPRKRKSFRGRCWRNHIGSISYRVICATRSMKSSRRRGNSSRAGCRSKWTTRLPKSWKLRAGR